MHNFVEEVAHLQFHAHTDEHGLYRSELADLATQHATQIQVHSICLGGPELSPQDEERYEFSHQ